MKTKQKKTVSSLSLAELREVIASNNAIVDSAEAQIVEAQAELRKRFEPVLAEYYATTDKTHGQHTFEVDGVKLVGEVKATIKWNSDALRGIAQTLPAEVVNKLFKIDFAVPEKTYQSITDTKLLDRLIDARTVKYSDPKISFA
jgi:hypothetical protein